MGSDVFYITLPSNVSSVNYFPENVLCNYATKLAQTVRLDTSWKVALTEVSYTYSWFNMPETEYVQLWSFRQGIKEPLKLSVIDPKTGTSNVETVYYKIDEEKKIIKGISTSKKEYKYEKDHYIFESKANMSNIKKGLYTNIDALLKNINSTIQLVGDKLLNASLPYLEFNVQNRRVTVTHGIQKDFTPVYLKMSDRLWNMLGFDAEKMQHSIERHMFESLKYYLKNKPFPDQQFTKLTIHGDTPYNLTAGVHSLYIYSNLVKPSFVGDSYSQLLRVVDAPNIKLFGEQIKEKFSKPYYLPLSVTDFDIIEIDIKDDIEESIKFEYGRVYITLEFRRFSNSYIYNN